MLLPVKETVTPPLQVPLQIPQVQHGRAGPSCFLDAPQRFRMSLLIRRGRRISSTGRTSPPGP